MPPYICTSSAQIYSICLNCLCATATLASVDLPVNMDHTVGILLILMGIGLAKITKNNLCITARLILSRRLPSHGSYHVVMMPDPVQKNHACGISFTHPAVSQPERLKVSGV